MAKKIVKKPETIPIITDLPKTNYKCFYKCELELLEDTMFVSSEFGNEYHCRGLIGNTAIAYAIGWAESPYKKFKKPMHSVHLKQLAVNGIYITPATPIGVLSFKMDRFNARPENYNLTWGNTKGRNENYPDEGWFKLLRRGNKFIFYILSEKEEKIPNYIRLGKFMSKAHINASMVDSHQISGEVQTDQYLRAEDIPPTIQISQYDKTPIQHGTYISKLLMRGEFYMLPFDDMKKIAIPKGSAFYCA